ncbi:ATP-binding protein [Chryseobacterium sp. GVT01B]|uniref:ATP-binding protein n=1 Tax=Chryseobacterium sp. GVT01B TaxID=2862675 RepID=UPI001CBBAAEC|nr:ATP-binding protein [Chryseobacterium sp. GVT01B]
MAKVNFRTNVLLKNIIGKDLITDDNVAVLELVKNSFDAGSNNANIIFRDVITNQTPEEYKKTNKSKFILRDNGSGMSEYDLINKWLNIAYSDKKSKKQEFNRNLAGNKGVGRFSCDRLGKSLVIYTKKINKPLLRLSIDWTKFEKIDDIKKNIQDIDFDLVEISPTKYIQETGLEVFDSGTTLFISNLRDIWDFDKIKSLKRQLERFINPNQNFESESFDINIEANEFINYELNIPEVEKINGIIKNRIFSELNFKATYINSIISEDGKLITTELIDRGKKIFTLVEHNLYTLLKNIEINIYYLNPYSKAYFRRQTGIRSVDFGSIFLFINGFRIPPYGDQGNDWLGMERRKGQGYNRFLGTREVIGRIEINGVNFDDERDDFFIISNRSGVDSNKHFEQLTKNDSPYGYYFKIFRRLERFVVEGIKWDSSLIKENEIEKKVLNDKNWSESDEKYIEDSLERNKRIISNIEKIINVRGDDVISLSINKKFVEELAHEQAQRAHEQINFIINELKGKDLTSSQLNDLIGKISKTSANLKNFPSENFELENLFDEVQNLKTQLESGYKKRKELEDETIRLQKELEIEKDKNTYLRTSSRSLSEDAKGLIHNIKITSKKISTTVDNLYYKISEETYKKNDILKSLGNIKFQAEKALKISKIITRSNFKTDKNEQIVDIVKYIEQYIEIYSDLYEKTQMSFKINSNNAELVKKVSLLDISIILDDLISNAEKAGANKILINISNIDNSNLKIIFNDNGNGVNDIFLDNPERIFELGVTTTDGSGIGLNSVRTALKSIQGKITFLGNNLFEKGATFEILINN